MRAKLLGISLLLLSSACTTWNVEKRVGARIEESCVPSASCTIAIRDLTDFGWDRMYAFKYNAGLEQIQTAIGTKFPDFDEFARKLVFLKEGKVVHREDEPTDIEKIVEGEVVFDIPDNEVYRSYTPETAVFRAEKKKSGNTAYYELTQIVQTKR